MKAVWKQPMKPHDWQELILPANAEILCVKVQNNIPTLWYINPDTSSQEVEARVFRVVGTGHENEELGKYIGTFFYHELVFHIFEDTSS